jgi:Lrp/AsnC family leucine-responsive transcriptional regulator
MLLRPPREWQQIMQQEPTDERDRAILRELMRDGRLTNVELAERVNLSPSACLRRVRAMEERGLIAGYVMLLDTARANMSGVAFVSVTLKDQGRTTLDKFEAAAQRYPEIVECYLIAGPQDYVLRVVYSGCYGSRAHSYAHLDPAARGVTCAVSADLAHGQAHHGTADLIFDSPWQRHSRSAIT